jgi:hypothetical protein
MSLESRAMDVLRDWYSNLHRYQDNLPAKGSVTAALHVLGRLRREYDLNVASHVAEGGSQIAGLSAASLRKTLTEFGETRQLTSVGGRSNRGSRGDVAALLAAMQSLQLDSKTLAARQDVLTAMQRHIVNEYIAVYFALKRVKATFDPNSATRQFIHTILNNAKETGKAGAVAEYLVGAKLQLKFPDENIRNKRFSTADVQSGHCGDFEVGNTVFHVTVAPMPEVFEKCKMNLERGKRVYLLVPNSHVEGARQNAELCAAGRIAAEPIESFVATNVDEAACFDGERLKSGFRCLLELYNTRVDEVEMDKSMLVEIPPNLQ